tara:strand:+ start:105 stop:473 length:369 start_codon:yes stop_codon:yes gene_type:complete
MKYCQGPLCHTYDTKDRKRGPKGNKVNQTRRRSNFYYMGGNVCSMQCQDDWFKKFGEQALNHFGRITQPIVLTENNAWRKQYRWGWQQDRGQTHHYFYNMCTGEERDITEQQFDDDNYTLNT